MLAGGSRADLALMALTQAQQLLESAAPAEAAARELAAVHIALGQVLLALLQYDRAEAALHQGLSLAAELADELAVGTVCLQLGLVAVGRNERALAAERFGRARLHLEAVGDLSASPRPRRNCRLAHQRGDLAEAERGYGEALALAQGAEQDALAAQLHLSLAQVTEQPSTTTPPRPLCRGHPGIPAESDAPALAAAEAGLAELLLHQGQFATARIHAEAARAVAEGPAGRAMPWRAYLLLQRIAAAEGDGAKADHWRRRTQETFAASPDAEGVRSHWRPLVEMVARACHGERWPKRPWNGWSAWKHEEWQQLAQAIWRILSGERGEDLWRDLDHIDALVCGRSWSAWGSTATRDGPRRAGRVRGAGRRCGQQSPIEAGKRVITAGRTAGRGAVCP
jgi:tetratricopeptide (TPR) repeat protein